MLLATITLTVLAVIMLVASLIVMDEHEKNLRKK